MRQAVRDTRVESEMLTCRAFYPGLGCGSLPKKASFIVKGILFSCNLSIAYAFILIKCCGRAGKTFLVGCG